LGSSAPNSVATDPAGNVFFVNENTVLRLDATTGILTLVAGNGTTGYNGDNGPATAAQLNAPTGLAVDSAGNLYLADTGNNLIREVSSGVISTVAGNGTPGFSGDNGPATSAQLKAPLNVALDGSGNPCIADTDGHRIRKVSPSGTIITVAGTGTAGYSGDGGPATVARLDYPESVALDAAGNLYIADSNNGRVRMVSTGGIITTVVGNGPLGYPMQLMKPIGVAVASGGNVYVADSGAHVIRLV
jgi:sugar lactone lactonase YvrE